MNFWVDVFQQVVEQEDWTEGYLASNGLTAKFLSGEEFQTFVNDEAAKYEAVLDTIGLLAE